MMGLARRLRAVARRGVNRLRRQIDLAAAPVVDDGQLDDVLASFDVVGDVVCVHSSLSACGRVAGGTDAVIDALVRWAGPRTLAMPTHTYCYGDPAPVFDVRETPSVVGAVTDAFWRRHGVVRSNHPSHSLAALGAHAVALCANHERCATPCGVGTPYERLVKRSASVLMFGATLNAYTLFHTAEDAAEVPYLYVSAPQQVRYRRDDGTVETMSMRRQDMSVIRRFADVDRWLEARGLLRRRTLGRGVLLFVPDSGAAHAAIVDELRRHPWFLTRAGAPR
jgi:aminoglycoside 3-N-acetyltransferase